MIYLHTDWFEHIINSSDYVRPQVLYLKGGISLAVAETTTKKTLDFKNKYLHRESAKFQNGHILCIP